MTSCSKLSTVSSTGVKMPSRPVKFLATNIGWRQEPLDLAGPGHGDAVLLGELVEAEDGDDVLQLLVALEDLLHAAGHVVVALADDLGREDGGGRGQRVDGRVDAEGGDVAGQLGGGVEVREGGERRRVGVVVGGHVHGLQRGDRPAPGRGDALLELAHLVGEGGLVAHRRRHAAEEGGHLGAGLHEAEDVVDEEEHVLVLHVAEVLGDGEGRQGDPEAHAGRLVHLAEHEGGLVEHAVDLPHLEEEVGALTGALADAGEHRHATELRGDPVDHLGDEHGLAHAGAAEQADLAALEVGGEQVDDLDARGEHDLLRLEGVEVGGVAVDLPAVLDLALVELVDVEGLADDVHHVAEHGVAHRHGEADADVLHRGAAHEAVGGLQADGPHAAVADLLGDLGPHLVGLAVDGDVEAQHRVDLRHGVGRELDVDHGAGDGDDAAVLQGGLGSR